LAVIKSSFGCVGKGLEQAMIKLDKSLQAWGSADFKTTLQQEVMQLGADQLPLQQGLTTGNYVSDTPITVSINRMLEMDDVIRVTIGIFYQGIIGGCSCTDDPTPISDINEYCDVQLDIEKSTALTVVTLVTE